MALVRKDGHASKMSPLVGNNAGQNLEILDVCYSQIGLVFHCNSTTVLGSPDRLAVITSGSAKTGRDKRASWDSPARGSVSVIQDHPGPHTQR